MQTQTRAPFVVRALWALVRSCGVDVAVTFDEDSSSLQFSFPASPEMVNVLFAFPATLTNNNNKTPIPFEMTL